MRMMGMMAIGGIAGFMILKFLFALIFPLFGLVFGVMGTVLKVGLWIAIGYFVYTLLKGRRREAEDH